MKKYIFYVKHELKVEITDEDVQKARSENRSLTGHGILGKDVNLAKILAANKGLERIVKQAAEVKVSIDLTDDTELELI